ncbi:MAG: tetratricopeptide repeat protein [Planctomycetota bacterium]
MSRLQQIEAMLADEPGDPFLTYSLAMELRREGEFEKSLSRFDELIAGNPPHIQAMFMSAQMLADRGQIEDARTRLRDGIDEARRQGNHHAAGEMSELLASLGQFGEDEEDEL